MPKAGFTSDLWRHFDAPPAQVPGGTVRGVLETVFAGTPVSVNLPPVDAVRFEK